MSSKTTIVWLLVAVVLGAAALLMLRSNSGGPRSAGPTIGERILQLDPADVRSITIAHADGSSETVERGGPAGAAWSMRVRAAGAPTSAAAPAWPVSAQRVQALLRVLNDVQVRAAADKNAQFGPRSLTLTLTGSRGVTTVIRLADQSLAGKALVEVETPPANAAADGRPGAPARSRAMVDDALHLLFRDHAAREWRDRTALFGASLDASRVRLENNKGVALALGKVDGAWSVREPLAAPGDPATIQRLLNSVLGVQIVDFLDQGVAAASTQLDPPAARLTLETDRRETSGAAGDPGAGAIVVESRELDLGGAADAAGTRLFARIDGERTVVIDARAVGELKLEPALYIWPFPTRLNPGDIGTIALERSNPDAAVPGSVYKRELDRWKQIRADGQEVLLPESEARPVTALLGFLCGPAPGAAGPAPGTPPLGPTAIAGSAPEGLASLGRITLLSLSGAPLDTLEVGSARPGAITIRTGPIHRTFSLDRAPSLIADFAQMAPPSNAKDATGVPEDGK